MCLAEQGVERMRKQEKSNFSPPALGGSSLLVVFAVLSLTIFALLSLSTVRADQRLGEASAKAVADYYAADCRAQEILASLRAGKPAEGVELAEETLEHGDEDSAPRQLYSYQVPISENQVLWVVVELTGSGGYVIHRWQAVAAGQWQGQEGLDVYIEAQDTAD